MKSLLIPGAMWNGEYCQPCDVPKNASGLTCPHCRECVIIRKGDVNVHHFAHKSGERKCKFYEHPGESEIHSMVKHIIADLLRKKKIKKVVCSCPTGCTYDVEIEYEEGDEAIVEHRVNPKCQVDVAVINNGKLKYIIEVYNTHKTTRETPEPWFEIDAKEFSKDDDNIHCIRRRDICSSCLRRINNINIPIDISHVTVNPERLVKVVKKIKHGYIGNFECIGPIKSIGEKNGILIVKLNEFKYKKASSRITFMFKSMIFKIWNSFDKYDVILRLESRNKEENYGTMGWSKSQWTMKHRDVHLNNNNPKGDISILKHPHFATPKVSRKTTSIEELFKRSVCEVHELPDEDHYYE